MRKVLTFILFAAVLVAAAYVAGYWPQRRRASELDAEKAALQQRLDAAEARVRVGLLLGELLTLEEVAREMNYGQARGLSSPFFDRVAAEAGRSTDLSLRQALESVLALRDRVTVALTQGDPAAVAHLGEAERRLRMALGYPVPPTPAATPAPALPTPLPGGALPTPVPLTPGLGVSPPGPLGLPPAPTTPTPTPAA